MICAGTARSSQISTRSHFYNCRGFQCSTGRRSCGKRSIAQKTSIRSGKGSLFATIFPSAVRKVVVPDIRCHGDQWVAYEPNLQHPACRRVCNFPPSRRLPSEWSCNIGVGR